MKPLRRAWSPARFDQLTGSWRPAEVASRADPATPGPATLSLATWNVWFGADHAAARADAILEILAASEADVICLQEVTPAFLARMLQVSWVRRDYCVADATAGSVAPYGVTLLTRLPLCALRCHELPTSMGRGLLVAELLAGGRPLAVGTVHLESLRPHAAVRAAQLAIAFPALRSAAPDAILGGDLNFDASWPEEQRHLPCDFVDAWPSLRGADPGFTLDPRANRMTARYQGRYPPARFDRVLLHSPGRRWRPHAIDLLGTRSIAPTLPEVFPSDHFGLLATFQATSSTSG